MIFRKVLCLAAILFLLAVPCVYAQSLLHRSLSTASDAELRAMATSFGLESNGDGEELVQRILDYFGMGDDVVAVDSSSDLAVGGDGRSTTISIEHSNFMFTIGDVVVLDGDVSLSFTDSSGSKKTLSAGKVVVDIGLKAVEASGDVLLEEEWDATKSFSGGAVSFNWGSMDVIVFNGMSSTERKNASGADVSLFVSGRTISYDGEKSIVFFDDGVISTAQDDPYWSIEASKVSFSGSDVFVDGALVKLGRVPIFYFPFFFYPGTTLAFNPAIGLSSDKGRFINTTTELYGVYPGIGRTASSSSSSSDSSSGTDVSASILSLLDSGDSSEKIRDGFVYRSVSDGEDLGRLETWARKSKSYFAFFADAYEKIGLVAGYDTSNTFFDGALTVDSLGAIAYNAAESTYSGRTRYYIDLNLKFKSKDLSVSLKMPYSSDYLAKMDLLNRNTKFGIDAVFGTNQEFPDLYSSQRQYSWALDANASLKLGAVSLKLSSLKAQIDFELESKYSDGRYSYEPKIRSASLPDLSFSSDASWTVATFSGAVDESRTDGNPSYQNELAQSFEEQRLSLVEATAAEDDSESSDSTVESLGNASESSEGHSFASAADEEVSSNDGEGLSERLSTYNAPTIGSAIKASSSSNGSIRVGYTFNQVFKNKYSKELEPSSIYSKTYGSIYLKGSSPDSWFVVNETLKPQYSFSNDVLGTKDGVVSYKRVHDLSFVSNLEVQSQPIGLTYRLSNKVYTLSSKETSGVVSQDISKWGGWNSSDVTEHSIEFKQRIGDFTFGLKGTMKPVKESLKPSVSFSQGGFSVSADMSFNENDDGFGPGLGNLGVGYKNSWLNVSIKNAFDFEKFDGADFVSGYSLSQSASLKFFSGNLSFSEDLSYKAGLQPSAMKFSATTSMGLGGFVSNGSYSISFKGEESEWNLDFLKVKFDNRLRNIYFWKHRIGLEMSVTADFTYSFANPYSTSLTFGFDAQFSIAEFLSLDVGVRSSNRSFYRYFDNGSFSFGSMLEDLIRSFDFFGDGRRSTGFNLSSINVELVHYMRDWDLCLSVEGSLKAQRSGRYAWSPVYKVYVKWNAIPELKVEKTIDKSKED